MNSVRSVIEAQTAPLTHLITPGEQQDLAVGFLGGGGDFHDDGLHHDCAVGEVLDGVTFEHTEAKTRKSQM